MLHARKQASRIDGQLAMLHARKHAGHIGGPIDPLVGPGQVQVGSWVDLDGILVGSVWILDGSVWILGGSWLDLGWILIAPKQRGERVKWMTRQEYL